MQDLDMTYLKSLIQEISEVHFDSYF